MEKQSALNRWLSNIFRTLLNLLLRRDLHDQDPFVCPCCQSGPGEVEACLLLRLSILNSSEGSGIDIKSLQTNDMMASERRHEYGKSSRTLRGAENNSHK